MKKKLERLSAWCFLLALAVFALAFVLFHYLTDSGFTAIWQPEADKPIISLLFAFLGVLFLFSSVLSLMLAHIFFPKKEE